VRVAGLGYSDGVRSLEVMLESQRSLSIVKYMLAEVQRSTTC